jgi:integrase
MNNGLCHPNSCESTNMRTSKTPFTQFAEEVLTIYGLESRKATVVKMRQVLREIAQVAPTVGALKPVAIAKWRNAHPGRSPATIDSLMRSLRAACAIGIASGYWTSSPLAVPQLWPDMSEDDDEDDDEPSHHSIASIRRVLQHLQAEAPKSWHAHRLFALACTVALTGIRKNEALHLTIPDIDFETRTIRVMSKRARRSPRRSAGAKPKTKASQAPVGMPPELVPILEAWIPLTAAIWLFPGFERVGPWTGGPPGHKPLERLKAEASIAGVVGFTFQSLRHSWATHAEYFGLGDTMIQRQLRHTTRRTQLVYRHADLTNMSNSVRPFCFLSDSTAPAQAQA